MTALVCSFFRVFLNWKLKLFWMRTKSKIKSVLIHSVRMKWTGTYFLSTKHFHTQIHKFVTTQRSVTKFIQASTLFLFKYFRHNVSRCWAKSTLNNIRMQYMTARCSFHNHSKVYLAIGPGATMALCFELASLTSTIPEINPILHQTLRFTF